MLEMLKERKEALEARGEKGFTLMEMLIVIAIIAILIAIAIPIFTAQLENARDATSVANMRSAYAEAQTAWITNQDDPTGHYTVDKNAGTVEVNDVHIASEVASEDWSGVATELPWWSTVAEPADPGTPGDYKMTFTYDENSEIAGVALTQ